MLRIRGGRGEVRVIRRVVATLVIAAMVLAAGASILQIMR